ncbi:uncharacterized protein (DUF2147 family) [Bradyrhizobium sp. GM2.2]|jgi:uncharacterized protein (DUF2147 family)|uniref:DUF2147 domain-containing protein n=1 Tax=Bradyrhizobium TaxID=374 RepID=UPI00195C2A6E|nr:MULTISPECIES: DUF2147 domain-containing protein [Bradyrhizobium]MBM7481333.1 uncharacterized protein (DUF2147 family) [Bradyrhizobium canariense]MCK1349123.1 DUF2147 domain-containing protein [Bradyrhizobium sp. CW11]MCK1471084.1 DUF2147 domain-containing protein [Bradyrhizobium sp. CW10]MCK1488683.1 DUF2147 domain-containing protein [Bradyrhizobium sp. 193]MCK1522228.1 DUF2147 domain-containing protein [Bradyrhizobium sp. 17]
MRLALYTGLILAGGYTCLNPALAADPTGDWRVADGVANIRVAQCNGSMWGAVSWEKQPGGRDENNPDASKKTRPTLGMATLIDMKKKPGADQWEGQVYNAKDGQLYSATITPVGTDQLEIKGCVMGFLCGGETWTRVSPPIPLSSANAMAKGAPKPTGAAPKAPGTTGATVAQPAPAAPKAAGTAKPGQKGAADQVGDICLLPEIAGFAH